MKFVSLIIILSMALSSCTPATKEETAQKELRKIMEENGAVGLSVAVVKEGKIIYAGAFGEKNREEAVMLDTNHLFRIASISKSFTVTSVMQLAEKGLLSLEDDVSSLIGFQVRNPKFPDRKITLKMLLSHTSGLRDTLGYFNLDVVNPDKNPDHAKAWHSYGPGEGYDYCNLGFNMTGAIIERISGFRFDNYVKENVLRPLGLYGGYNVDSLDNSLFVSLYQKDSTENLVIQPAAYRSRAGEIDSAYVMGYSTPLFSPTGGMKISVPDLARYMIMHMEGGIYNGVRVISEESSATMQNPVIEIDENNSYCLALRKTKNLIPGEILNGHTGSAYGLYSAMFFEPHKRYGFVMATNGCNPVYREGYTVIQADVIRALYRIFID